MKAILYIIKSQLNISLTYRFEVISGFLTNFILMFVSVYFWKAAYLNKAEVAGVDSMQMITYTVIVTILNVIISCDIGDALGSRIRDGNIALDMMKPISIYIIFFAQDIGRLLSSLILNALPLLIFSLIFVKFSAPVSLTAFICFLISAVFSYLIIWLISAIVGMLTFWAMNVGPLGFVKNVIIRILSGSIVPIWFFPKAVQTIINYTPFVYTYQLTAGVYIGKINVDQAFQENVVQFSWIIILFMLFNVLRIRSISKVMIQGG